MTGQRLSPERLSDQAQLAKQGFAAASPFSHAVIDGFLPAEPAQRLAADFPAPDHPIWADWRLRTGHQYGKQGTRNSDRFHLLPDSLYFSLLEFNSSVFLAFLEQLTGIDALLPDPYFQGGGMHQIVSGGILDIHTDFNAYGRLKLYRRLNVLLYLTDSWAAGDGGGIGVVGWPATPGHLCETDSTTVQPPGGVSDRQTVVPWPHPGMATGGSDPTIHCAVLLHQ